MKYLSLFFILNLFSGNPCFSAENYNLNKMAEQDLLEALAGEFVKDFKSGVHRYHKRVSHPESLLKDLSSSEFKDFVKLYSKDGKHKEFLPVKLHAGRAFFKTPYFRISLSASGLMKNEIYINGKAFKIDPDNGAKSIKLLTQKLHSLKKYSWLDFVSDMVIPKANAYNYDFEDLVNKSVLSVLGLNDSLEGKAFWCLKCLGKVYRGKQVKKNLEAVFKDINKKAKNCEDDVSGMVKQQQQLISLKPTQDDVDKLMDLSEYKTHSFMAHLKKLEQKDKEEVELAMDSIGNYLDIDRNIDKTAVSCRKLDHLYRRAIKDVGDFDAVAGVKSHCRSYDRLVNCMAKFTEEGNKIYARRKTLKEKGLTVQKVSAPYQINSVKK